jgi:two-component system NtrC family sensor kinase
MKLFGRLKIGSIGIKRGVILLLTLLLFSLGIISIYNRMTYREPTDGADWVFESETAPILKPGEDSPAFKAGLRDGDRLLSVSGIVEEEEGRIKEIVFSSSLPDRISYILAREGEKRFTFSEKLSRPEDARKILFQFTPGDNVEYTVIRGEKLIQTTLTLEGVPLRNNNVFLYLSFVGISFLVVGISVLLRRGPDLPGSHHFFFLSLLFFILFVYSPTTYYGWLNKTIYWLDETSRLFLPPFLLHFFLLFPRRRLTPVERKKLLPLIYAGSLSLFISHLILMNFNLFATGGLLRLNNQISILSRIELAHLGFFFALSIFTLLATYRTSRDFVVKKQAKWMLSGIALGFVPLILIYIPAFLLNRANEPITFFSIAPLVIIPISFAYAIIRYRLMDIEVLLKRGMVFGLAIGSVMGLYLLLISIFSRIFTGVEPEILSLITFLTTLLVAILFTPLKRGIEYYLDRLWYREKYDIRATLREFTYELSSEVDLDRLLYRLKERIAGLLDVSPVAIFLNKEERFTEFHPDDEREAIVFNKPFSSYLARTLIGRDYVLFPELSDSHKYMADERKLADRELFYLIPLVTKDELIGLIALGRKGGRDLLSSEDHQLLSLTTTPAAMGIENALLYQNLKQKLEELSQLKEYHENIVESVNAGVLVIDLEGEIVSLNRKLTEIYGLSRDQAMGKKITDVFPREFISQIGEFLGKNGWRSREITNLYKLHLKTARGELQTVNISVAPLLSDDREIYGKVLIIDDVTKRVDLEQQLAESERLASLGFLAASVAHEVNTPLTGIASYTQMLLKKIPEKDPKAKVLKKMEKQAFRASRIVNNLLDFSRRKEPSFLPIDVNRVIKDTISLFHHQLKNADIRLKLQLKKDIPPTYGDEVKLQQLFLNLLANAKEAMPRGGELGISTNNINSSIVINIKDTGTGIAKENLNRIYEPFFTTKSKKGTGLGLGLTVCYGIVQEHLGSISVKSAPGAGTNFSVKLPVYRGKDEQKGANINRR